jgi:probable rRNA maturation factor
MTPEAAACKLSVESSDLGESEPFLLVNRQRKHKVDRAGILDFLSRLAGHLSVDAPFSVVLVSDRAIHRYNREYREQDKATDVLSFPGDDPYLGDILISMDTAYYQAERSTKLTLDSNIRRLALHGLLHLLGHDHETDDGQMRALEIPLRRRFRC